MLWFGFAEKLEPKAETDAVTDSMLSALRCANKGMMTRLVFLSKTCCLKVGMFSKRSKCPAVGLLSVTGVLLKDSCPAVGMVSKPV